MNHKLCLLPFLLLSQYVTAQQITCSLQDKQAVEDKIGATAGMLREDFGQTLVTVGKTFLGTAYVAKTLEFGQEETLVINLQGLDCTTFVENVLAFSLMLKAQQTNFGDFARTLEHIRYKDGKLDGYASRLHYFTEWIANNESKGLLRNITKHIGGTEITKDINFMSTHRELYPFLSDDANLGKLRESEEYLNSQPICMLPREEVAASEPLIHSGDIIALTTSIEGLDVTHTGIATREADGRIHLLHASSSGQVEVSALPLADYLNKLKNNTGILVARPL
jgi:hypothetical protein